MSLSKLNTENIKKYLSTIPKSVWILGLIIFIGIFLRTYNFRDWLYFYPDQARDVTLVRDVLNGNAPIPLLGFRAASTFFELGAMYYYFQIISGWIFGVAPQAMAYPDLFFNILVIPLLYYFLRKLFRVDISLFLTGLYAISYYAIEFSRFAWNSNPMPFFVLLFLLSLWNLLSEGKRVGWGWIFGLGIALGVGVQLHTILLYLLPTVTFVYFIISMKSDWRLWSRWLVIFILALVLNTNQIVSETEHHFSNTKELIKLSVGASETNGVGENANKLALNATCQVQANTQIISALGNTVYCDFWKLTSKFYKGRLDGDGIEKLWMLFGIGASLVFSLFGYGLLLWAYWKESDKKRKNFLGLIAMYAGLSFAVVFPVISDGMPLRYYLQVFFVPFVLLGLMLELAKKKLPKIFIFIMIAVGIFFTISNFKVIFSEANLYSYKMHSNSQYVVLEELNNMRDYIMEKTNDDALLYMIADGKYMQNYWKPLVYVFSEKNIALEREQKNLTRIPAKEELFYVGAPGKKEDVQVHGFDVLDYRNFGEIGIYILDNTKH